MTRDEAKDLLINTGEYISQCQIDVINEIYNDFESRLKTKRNYGLEKQEEWRIGNHAQYYQGYSHACGELLEGLADD